MVRYGSRLNTKKRTIKIKGSVRFALLTIGQKKCTVTVALAVKYGTVKKTENGTDTVAVTNSDPLLYVLEKNVDTTFSQLLQWILCKVRLAKYLNIFFKNLPPGSQKKRQNYAKKNS